MKKQITKCLVSVLALAMVLTSLPQNMMTTKATENTNEMIVVSGGDLVEEVVSVDEEIETMEESLKFVNEQTEYEEDLPLYLGAAGGLSAEVSNGAVDLVISTPAELKSFADSVRMGDTFAGRLVKLGADIAFDGITVNNFTPIGSDDYAFEGTFDGAGHTISGLVIVEDEKSDYCGLFRKIASSGVVKSVTLSNSEIICTDEQYVGGLVGWNEGSVYNCKVKNTIVTSNADYEIQYVGGIAAYNNGVIDMCSTLNGKVGACETYNCNESKYVGGIAGYCSDFGKVRSSLNTANVYTEGYGRVYLGGVCGWIYSGELTNCANAGTIECKNTDDRTKKVGGVAGYGNGSAVVQLSYNTGDVTCATNYSDSYLGALVGYYTGSTVISHCYYSNALEGGNKDTSSSATVRNNTSMDLADMKLTTFADQLNAKVAANVNWLPWEIRAGLDYPQHVAVYAVSPAEDISAGKLSLDKGLAYAGLTVNFTVTPNTYYRISEVTVTGANGAVVTVNGTNGNYNFSMPASDVTVDVEFEYSKPIGDCGISLEQNKYTYDGSAKEPSVTVMDGTKELVEGTDYTISYSGNINAGTGKVTLQGLGTYTGSKIVNFTIAKSAQKLSVSKSSYTKTHGDSSFSIGAKTINGPGTITYKSSDTSVVKEDSAGNVTIQGPGYVTITVTAAGDTNYEKETQTVTVIVEPKKQTVSSVKTTTGRGLQIIWVKDTKADGYLVEYSKDKKSWSSRRVYGAATNNTTISGLIVGTTYYVRVRSYVNANNTTYYGEYSSVKSCKVKGDVKEAYITLSKTSYVYDGKAKAPTVKVTHAGKTLKKGTDYTVKYSKNKNVGTAKVTITGKGNYSGTVTKTFKITKITPTFTGSKSYNKKQGDSAFTLNTKLKKGKGYTQLTYKSSNTKVATVSSTGKVTINGAGKAVITITAKGNSYCNKATRKVTINVKKRK